MARAELNPIYERLNGAGTYHPFSANTFSDWSLEAGDTITVKRDGQSYTSPVHSSTVRWAGQQQISVESTGDKERGPVAKMSASNYAYASGGGNSYRTGARRKKIIEGELEQSDENFTRRINNFEAQVGTRFEQTDRSVSMSVGTLKYSKVANYSSKSKFPAKGSYDTLYVAKDTGQSYAWINPPGVYYVVTPTSNGEANYLKVGEIALAFNEQTGKTEAKLDADVIYAGKVNGRLVSLADLELPDWMGATDEGIVALQGNFGKLNARVANIEKITAKAITTDNLYARIAALEKVSVKSLVSERGGVSVASVSTNSLKLGGTTVPYQNMIVRASVSGNVLTLTPLVGKAITFSKATSLSAKWSSGTGTITASPQNEKYIIRLVETQGYWDGNTYYGLVGDANHDNEYTGFNYSVDASDKVRVSSSEIGGSVTSTNPPPQSSGSSTVDGRLPLGFANLPSVPSYLLLTLSCRGTTRQAFIKLG